MSDTRTAAGACRLPACDGRWHEDGDCVVQLGETRFDGPQACLSAELSVEEGQAPKVVAFVFNPASREARREMRDRASTADFAAQLRRLADAIDTAAAFMPPEVAS